MARIYYKNADGDYIRDDSGDYMTGEPEDCCCEENCCSEEGGPPTADFSYTQTGTSPCVISLHNESTAGTCGEIVSWEWFLNDDEEPFSTDENPTGVEVTSGDDITLVATDSEGCTDSVVMEISCVVATCGTCGIDSGSTFEMSIPGVGTYTLSNSVYSPTTNCQWTLSLGTNTTCGEVETLTVQWNLANGGWGVYVQLSNGGLLYSLYRSDLDEQFLGCGPWTVNCPQNFGTFGNCALTSAASYDVTITLIP